jgi:hypothetical protein
LAFRRTQPKRAGGGLVQQIVNLDDIPPSSQAWGLMGYYNDPGVMWLRFIDPQWLLCRAVDMGRDSHTSIPAFVFTLWFFWWKIPTSIAYADGALPLAVDWNTQQAGYITPKADE